MKVLTVSDLVSPVLYPRFDQGRFPDVDLILSCGDLPPEYLTFLVSVFDAPMYYVRGNHDLRYREKPPSGGINLHGNLLHFKGLRIMGFEGSRWYNGGPMQYTEQQMRRTVGKIRPLLWWNRGVDIVVTHAPPRHIHDAEDLCHRGFQTFRQLIDRYQPGYFFHGHVHAVFDNPSERITIINKTNVVNCCGYYFLDIETHQKSELPKHNPLKKNL